MAEAVWLPDETLEKKQSQEKPWLVPESCVAGSAGGRFWFWVMGPAGWECIWLQDKSWLGFTIMPSSCLVGGRSWEMAYTQRGSMANSGKCPEKGLSGVQVLTWFPVKGPSIRRDHVVTMVAMTTLLSFFLNFLEYNQLFPFLCHWPKTLFWKCWWPLRRISPF
jgi:hypothetical protein